jgi:hypothetical protein
MTDRPPFWSARAERLTGKHVLVGKTILDENENIVEQSQFHRHIETASDQGISVRRLDTGAIEWAPARHEGIPTSAAGRVPTQVDR